MHANSLRSPSSLAVIVLLVASIITFVLDCSVRDLWEPEELRYSEVTREMMISGEYFVLHLNRLVYHEKPPLHFYSMALCTKVFGGLNAWAMRFPTAAAGFGCCVVALLFARRLYGEAAGVLSAFILFATPLFLRTASEARMDVLLTFFIMLSLYWFYLAYTERRSEGGRLLGMWVLFALGTLTKGPIGLILPLGTIVVYVLWRRDGNYLWKRKWWMALGFVLFVLIVAVWLVPACKKGGPEFTRNILFRQNIQRYTNAWDHEGKPLYAYVWIFPLAFMPWTLFLPGVVWLAVRRDRAGEKDDLALPLIWWAVIFLFFSFSSGKRTVYMVPLEPAAAMLVGWLLSKFWSDPQGRGMGWAVIAPAWLCLLAFAIAGIVSVVSVPQLKDTYPEAVNDVRLAGVATCAVSAIWIACALTRRWVSTVAMVPVAVVAVGWAALLTVGPFVNSHKSARIMLAKIEPLLHSRDELALFGTIRAGYSFYWGETIPIILKEDSEGLVEFLSRREPASVLLKRKFLEGKRRVRELEAMLGTKAHVLWEGRLGGRKLALVSNHQAPRAW